MVTVQSSLCQAEKKNLKKQRAKKLSAAKKIFKVKAVELATATERLKPVNPNEPRTKLAKAATKTLLSFLIWGWMIRYPLGLEVHEWNLNWQARFSWTLTSWSRE